MTNTITIYDYEDWTPVDECMPHDFIGPPSPDCFADAATLTVPAKREVCPRCNGEGVHDHPAFSNGVSPEMWDDDPDFREDYLSGVHDVTCSECKGKRVVDEPDWDRMTERQQELANTHYQALDDCAAEAAAERRVGA